MGQKDPAESLNPHTEAQLIGWAERTIGCGDVARGVRVPRGRGPAPAPTALRRSEIGSTITLYDSVSGISEVGLFLVAGAEGHGREKITKVEMARRMHTSRTALDRLLTPGNAGAGGTGDRARRELRIGLV
jgi:hypothetical protein